MEEFILTNIDVYGPIAVFIILMLSGIGLPIGEDLVIIPAGILVGNGDLPFWPTLIAAYVGVVCSDMLWFTICHRYGSHLIHMRWFKRMIHPRRLLEAKHQVEQRGIWVVVMARFIPASRTPTITIAGLLHLPFWKFALATTSCVCITAPMQLGLGYLIALGLGTHRLADLILYVISSIVLIVAIVIVVRWWQLNKPTKRRLPRAKMVWLKRFRVPRPRVPRFVAGRRTRQRAASASSDESA